MSNRFYVTTSIPYVNARPHVGFALELVQADVIARYHRLLGHETRFQTGTDENALKNVIAAQEQGISTRELVDRNSELFRLLSAQADISYDSFLRTTEERHTRAVHHLWRSLKPGDIYSKTYTGLYCQGCEDFIFERDLTDGHCPDHSTPPIEVQEENYFFRLSAYQEQVEEIIASDQIKIYPETRKNEVLSFIRHGLQDISVTRAAERSGGWGIPVPGDPSQVIYVWIDALINYISGLGYGTSDDWSHFWNSETRKIHVIGKNVWKFHAVYWPALLLSAGLPLPDEIVVHGFLTIDGRKISKSLGNSVDPFTCIEEFGTDPVRYYLLRAVSPFIDCDFSTTRLREIYNTDLANDLGNLLSRLTTLCARADYGSITPVPQPQAPDGYHEALANYEFDRALDTIWQVINTINREIQETEPWKLIRTDPNLTRSYFTKWLHQLHQVGYWLAPFLPDASKKILSAISQGPIRQAEPIFPRIVHQGETSGQRERNCG